MTPSLDALLIINKKIKIKYKKLKSSSLLSAQCVLEQAGRTIRATSMTQRRAENTRAKLSNSRLYRFKCQRLYIHQLKMN